MKHLLFISVMVFGLNSFGNEPELIIRADIRQPQALPVWSKMPSMSPSCNDNGPAVKYLSLFGDEKLHPAVSLFQDSQVISSDPLESDLSVSDPFITADQTLIFSLNFRGGTKGVFELKSDNSVILRASPADFPNVIAMSRPSFINGEVLYRALTKNGLHAIYMGSNKILEEIGNIAYLYLPTVKKNQIVLKVGLGKPGEVSQSNPDKIISILNGKEEIIASDQDLNPESDFISFDNSPIPDGGGGVAFIADHKVHGRSLWLSKNKETKLIFKSSEENGSLEYFSSAVNASGSLVFRVIKNKRISVMAWDHKHQVLKLLMEQGQAVRANEDNIRVIDRDRWPAFSGRPCITNSGNVYIHAVLESTTDFENKGSGVFKLKL